MKQRLTILALSMLFVGCVPTPQPTIGIGRGVGVPIGTTASRQEPRATANYGAYGQPPRSYATAIRTYFSTKLKRASLAQYQFKSPVKAYKKKGLAYGGDVAWRGWMVETLVAIPSRTGRLTSPKPHMMLFSGEQVIEDILGNSHRLLVRVED